METTHVPGGPHCALHPDVPAQDQPCPRCGSFACDACFDERDDAPPGRERLCRSCRERTGRGEIPWEDTRLPLRSRLGRTLQRALGAPVSTFEAIGEGDLGPAASFAALTTLLGYAPVFLLFGVVFLFGLLVGASDLGPLEGPRSLVVALMCAFPIVVPPFVLGASLFADLVAAVVFHVAAVVLGGRGSFEASLRAALYTSAVRVVLAPLSIVAFIPILGFVVSLATRVGMLVWASFAFHGTARRVHGLAPTPAAFAAAAPAVVFVGLFLAVLALAIALGLSGALREI